MAPVVAEQLVVVFVKVNVGLPAATAETAPPFVTVASELLLLTHVPPVVGDSVDEPFKQIAELPVIPTEGKAFTVSVALPSDVAVAPQVEVTVHLYL